MQEGTKLKVKADVVNYNNGYKKKASQKTYHSSVLCQLMARLRQLGAPSLQHGAVPMPTVQA